MMHLSDAELDICLDPRGLTVLAPSTRRHLESCDRCAARLTDLRDETQHTDELLGLLDHELPPVDPDALMRRAGRVERRRALAIAAGVAGLLAAGAAVAIPGSPLRQWLAPGPDSGAATSPLTAPDALSGPGVRFVPTGPVEVVFETSQEVGHILVTRTDEVELSVRAVDGPAAFSVGRNRVRVGNRGSEATYEVRVPTGVRALRLIIADATVLELSEDRVTVPPGLDRSVVDEGYLVSFPELR